MREARRRLAARQTLSRHSAAIAAIPPSPGAKLNALQRGGHIATVADDVDEMRLRESPREDVHVGGVAMRLVAVAVLSARRRMRR